jgi:hypothetical protein
MPIILPTWEAKIRRITVQGQYGQIVGETPISKITRAKWAGGMAQVAECLLLQAQSPEFNTTPLYPSPTRGEKFTEYKTQCLV